MNKLFQIHTIISNFENPGNNYTFALGFKGFDCKHPPINSFQIEYN